MRSCVRTNDEVAVGVQSAQKEHKLIMDKMITQVPQLADSINAIKGNAGKFQSKEYALDSADIDETPLKPEESCREPEVGILSDDSEGAEIVEDLRKVAGVSKGRIKRKESIEHLGEPRATLLSLETAILHSSEDLKELMSGRTGENPKQGAKVLETPDIQKETSTPVTDKREECSYKRRSNRGSERSGKRAAGKDDCRKQERWP